MTIDPTKDIVTEEEYSRPVMLLYALGNDTPYGFVVYNITKTATDEFWLMTDENRPALRNVAPPKPEPVLWEAWIVWNSEGGRYTPFTTEDDARDLAERVDGVFARAAAMSDGSPVEDDTPICAHCGGRHPPDCEVTSGWRTKAEEALSLLRTANDRVEALQADVNVWGRKAMERGDELDREAPVVDAAVAWADCVAAAGAGESLIGNAKFLYGTVRTYQQSPKKTAAEAVANVAAMMGSVRNCTTCHWFQTHCFDAVGACESENKWEPRHD